jgi:manganese-dependent inorganic pyrophosphatase
MQKVLILGHKNPDTDSICSAIAYADLKTKLGMNVESIRLGEINGETQFVLDYFKVEQPRLIDTVTNDVSQVILVDHNERQQSINGIESVQVLEVIDHHRIANFETSDQLYMRVEPVGCTATILNKLYKENNIEVPKEIAGLMLSAIISDTLLFKSPTCTDQDITAAKQLANIADVKAEEYGIDMLKAGTDLGGKTAEQLIGIDSKEFQMGNYKVEVSQINAVDPNDVLKFQSELEATISKVIEEKGLDLFLLVVTDILKSDSVALAMGREVDAIEKAYNVTLENNIATLKGVVSRKKQIVPVLTDVLAKKVSK